MLLWARACELLIGQGEGSDEMTEFSPRLTMIGRYGHHSIHIAVRAALPLPSVLNCAI